MISVKTIVLSLCISGILISTSLAQESAEKRIATLEQQSQATSKKVDDLDKKMQGVDDKLGKMLELMQLQQKPVAPAPVAPTGEKSTAPASTPSTAPSPVPAPAKKSVKYAPGAVLDFWVLTDDEPIETIPARRSLATIVDDKKLFEGGRYKSESSIKCGFEQKMGVCWKGYLRIKESGEHSFSADFSFSEDSTDLQCASFLKIEGFEYHLAKAKDKIRWWKPWSESTPFNLTLEPGLYKIELWMGFKNCGWGRGSLSSLSIDLKMRGPSDRTLRTLTADDIIHAE